MEKTFFFLITSIASAHCNSVPVINMNVVELREDIKVGRFAFQILASDSDGDPLTYDIRGPNAFHFDVVRETGEVKIKSMLDRETKDLFPIDVVVNDGVYPDVTKAVYIAVEDANDNQPVFQGLPYNREVPENTPVGSTIFTAYATDDDFGPAGIVSYKITEVVPNEGLSLFSINEIAGHVVLMGLLSFTEKSPFYQIRINASDGGGKLDEHDNYIQNSTTIAFITIKDVPDIDPQFLNLPNIANIDEHSPVGTSVFTVRARDPDTGINDPILFSIESTNAPELFQIDEDSGEVTVKTEFDREELLHIGALVELLIKARETNLNVDGIIASTIEELQISIGDLNDNGPDFFECDEDSCTQKSSFIGSVDEHSSTGVSVGDLKIFVKDPDQGVNSRFNLQIDGPDKDAFSVVPRSGVGESTVQVTIKDSTAVDYEIKTVMFVQIVATDASADFTSVASVTININDINDNSPEFEQEVYQLSVEEHCDNGTVLMTITATDADALDDGKLTYRLVPESILALFDVFPKNGTVYVKHGARLDWEGTNTYSPTLQARDSDGKIGSTVLEIRILDINDQTPEINREVYEAFVQENHDLKQQIQARDGDEPGTPNSQIRYRIEESFFSSNFTIGLDSGMLENNGPLDREAIDIELNGIIELKVTAYDMGSPSLSSSALVIITVGDVNDNSPKYLDPGYTFHVKESEGGILVGTVRAHDADQTDFNNRIVFTITDGSFGNFILFPEAYSEGYRGNITVDPAVELDYESDFKTYTLKVEASDLGQNKDETTVHVVVEDVNDTPPVFPSGMTLNVPENSTLEMPLDTIIGFDVDTNHKLEYELIVTECLCMGIRMPCSEEWFDVESNGDIVTLDEYVIDYEKCQQVFLHAMVVDVYTEKRRNSSEGVVTVYIEDINDNPPVFVKLQDFYVVVLERVESGSFVAKVYATDADSGENKKVKFTVSKVEFISSANNSTDLFLYADSDGQQDAEGRFSADIRSQKSLDSNQKGKFLVEVEAANPDGLKSVSVIEVLTVDSSYRVSLRFSSSVSEVNANLPQIRGILQGATKASVQIFNVYSGTKIQREEDLTVLEAYFVFPNGSALNYDDVTRILNSDEVFAEYGIQLRQLGFTGVSSTSKGSDDVKPEVFVMIGLMAALVIVLIVTTTSLVCIRKNFKRKLKAAKAMNSAATVVIKNQMTGPVVPGTNKYTKEGANPVLNMVIDTTTDLGFDEDGSNADRESLNSLEYNIDMIEKDTMPMMAIQEEEEESRSESPYIEALSAALAQRESKRVTESPTFSFTNPSMDTTDL